MDGDRVIQDALAANAAETVVYYQQHGYEALVARRAGCEVTILDRRALAATPLTTIRGLARYWSSIRGRDVRFVFSSCERDAILLLLILVHRFAAKRVSAVKLDFTGHESTLPPREGDMGPRRFGWWQATIVTLARIFRWDGVRVRPVWNDLGNGSYVVDFRFQSVRVPRRVSQDRRPAGSASQIVVAMEPLRSSRVLDLERFRENVDRLLGEFRANQADVPIRYKSHPVERCVPPGPLLQQAGNELPREASLFSFLDDGSIVIGTFGTIIDVGAVFCPALSLFDDICIEPQAAGTEAIQRRIDGDA